MAHTAKIVSKEKLSDSAIAVKLRCCEDESTDSVSTIYLWGENDTASLPEKIAKQKERVQNQHERMNLAMEALGKL